MDDENKGKVVDLVGDVSEKSDVVRTKYHTKGEVIHALAIYHLTNSLEETARRTGLTKKVIGDWVVQATDKGFLKEVNNYAKDWANHTTADLRVLASAALSQAYKTIDEASPLQAANIAAIAMEQIRKIEGNAEQITQNNFYFTDSTLNSYSDAEKIALMEKVANRRRAELAAESQESDADGR